MMDMLEKNGYVFVCGEIDVIDLGTEEFEIT